MDKSYYSYEVFLKDVKTLCNNFQDEKPDAIVAIARGGVTLGHFIASRLDIRNFYTISSILYNDTNKTDTHIIKSIPDLSAYQKILLVDDIVDSGETLQSVKKEIENKFCKLNVKTATLFYKTTAIMQADYSIHEAKNWIEFFWEKDI
jgi:xanthine phosphoribosyltransferase